MRVTGIIACFVVGQTAVLAQPVCTAWIRAAQTSNPTLDRVRPDVHDVSCGDQFVEIRSSGISLYQLGVLSSPVNPGNGVRDVRVRIPRHPEPETGRHASLPAGTIGVFLNGVPIENRLESDSFEGRNLWHYDLNSSIGADPGHETMTPVLRNLIVDGSRHSPIIGFALDGYPIYGPWGSAGKRMRSGYRLRTITQRTSWPDGTQLTPGQYGPPVDMVNPLGTFAEDYEFAEGLGDLDRFNGRFATTPEYPQGTYAYFLSADAKGELTFPYLMATHYYGRMVEAGPALARIAERSGVVLRSSATRPLAGVPVTFSFDFGVHALEYVHERPIHLIVVSEDLAEFSHVHPERGAGDSYRIIHTFAHGGHYRLYAEFTLPGSGPRVEAIDLQVAGPPKAAEPLAVTSRTQGGVELIASPALRAGTDETLRFRLNSNAGLEPYLGAWGHFVVVESGVRSFIHAHPIGAVRPQSEPSMPHSHAAIPPTEAAPESVDVPVAFPHAGIYKLWAQFQVNGEVRVIPFVLRVLPGATGPGATPIVSGSAIRLKVGPEGFKPARLEVPAGKAVTLAITRSSESNCAAKVLFPDLGIAYDLPLGKTTMIQLPAMTTREMRFACGMGMYRGLLVVR